MNGGETTSHNGAAVADERNRQQQEERKTLGDTFFQQGSFQCLRESRELQKKKFKRDLMIEVNTNQITEKKYHLFFRSQHAGNKRM